MIPIRTAVVVFSGYGNIIPTNRVVPRTKYAVMNIVVTRLITAVMTLTSSPSNPSPNRKHIHSAWVIQPDRRCHLPV